MKKLVVVLLLLVLIGGGGYAYYHHTQKVAKEAADKKAASAPAEVVERILKKQDVPLYAELPGRTTAHKVAEIRPQVTGIINKRLFEEGSDVEQGQQMYQINPAPFQAILNSAKADLMKAQANSKSVEAKAQRYAGLVKINAISKQDYDDTMATLEQAKADIAIAQASVETAQINLDFTKVYAPISGRVGKSNVTEGALVTAGQEASLATITQLDPIYVDLTQSSKDLLALREKIAGREKTTVSLLVEDSTQPYKHDGEIQFSEVTVDPTTGMVQLRAIFPNPEHSLLPGLFVRARIKLDTINAILLPQKAAIRNPDGSLSVWKVSADNKVNLFPIQVDRALNSDWIVSSGLEEGDAVVVSGFQKVAANGAVKPISEEEAAQKAKADAAVKKPADGNDKQAGKPADPADKDAAPATAPDAAKAGDDGSIKKDDAIAAPGAKDDTATTPAPSPAETPAPDGLAPAGSPAPGGDAPKTDTPNTGGKP
ncbi:MAG: efflux RND transporter periplasmic adaptor subunit [Micavibrio sp.]|nr:efflux RND transporter periplasmic adaptor subunit [Micavibrio sp.]